MLLAIRKSAASFNGAYNIRSHAFHLLLKERDAAAREIERLRDRLVPLFHELVPAAKSADERALLLKAKRNIWNRRAALPAQVAVLDGGIRSDVESYNDCLLQQAGQLAASRNAILAELRRGLCAMVQDLRFRTAVEYSCPWLIEAYERHPAAANDDFSDEERGLFSYGVKFFSKANPLHIFAGISFPNAIGLDVESCCEVVLDSSSILELERLLLPFAADPYRRLVYLRCSIKDGETRRFLTEGLSGLRLVAMKKTQVLEPLVRFLSSQTGAVSLGACIDHLLAEFPGVDCDSVTAFLEQLIGHGVLVPYLVKDFSDFSGDLSGLNRDFDERIHALQQLHLALIPQSSLPAAQRRLKEVEAPKYYVNSYCEWRPGEPQLDPVFADLRALKPFFCVLHNCSVRAHVIREFLTEQVAAHPNRSVPYLHAVCEFLRRPMAIIEQYSPSSPQPAADWIERLGAYEGEIGAPELETMLRALPAGNAAVPSLCFNGPFDYVTRAYYPANIFGGEGRYVSRYLLSKGTRRYTGAPARSGWIDVQLATPFRDNRAFVAALYPTGCGFEARYRHQFEHWIDPSDIFVEIQDSRVVYRHGPTANLLRIHYVGFLLAEHLTPDYALLLTDHADYYHNPFALAAREETLQHAHGQAIRIAGLFYRSVCLRREEWRVARGVLDAAIGAADVITAAVRLREFLQVLTRQTTDDWYFRAPRRNKNAWKPRYLDLRNPLSAHVLRRDISGMGAGDLVSFTRMEPPAANLYPEGGERFTTELMIEV